MEKFKVTLQDVTEYEYTVTAADRESANMQALQIYKVAPPETLHETFNFIRVADIPEIANYEAKVERNITYIVPIYSDTIEEASKKIKEIETSSTLEDYEVSRKTYVTIKEK